MCIMRKLLSNQQVGVAVGCIQVVSHSQIAFSCILGGGKGSSATPIAVYFWASPGTGDAN